MHDQLGLVFRSPAAGGPHVLHRPEPGVLRGIAERLGPAVTYFRLGAPGTAGDQWNGVERPEGRPAFQWSAATELAWDVTVPPGPKRRMIVDVPFVHVTADFLSGCKLRIAGLLTPINVRGHTIVGELADVEPGPVRVTLETPPLIRSRGADNRMIGIALRVGHKGPSRNERIILGARNAITCRHPRESGDDYSTALRIE